MQNVNQRNSRREDAFSASVKTQVALDHSVSDSSESRPDLPPFQSSDEDLSESLRNDPAQHAPTKAVMESQDGNLGEETDMSEAGNQSDANVSAFHLSLIIKKQYSRILLCGSK